MIPERDIHTRGNSLAVAWALGVHSDRDRLIVNQHCGLGLWGVGLVISELRLWPSFILHHTTIHYCFHGPGHDNWRLEVTSQVVLVMNESGVLHTNAEEPALQWHVFYTTTGILWHWTCYFAAGFANQVCLSDDP